MTDIAQTNLQLYHQLMAREWSDAELARTRSAYELATDLFAGQVRPSGKTFIAHLVGTASVLALVGARADMVDAGLLHAAYTHGDFGDGRRNATEDKRVIVRAAIGPSAETLIAGYSVLRYAPETIEDWLRRADHLSAMVRDLAILRLANEVDEHVDLGIRFGDRGVATNAIDDLFATTADVAQKIDAPALAELIREMSARDRVSSVPAVLRSSETASRVRAPRSYRLRVGIALRRTALADRLRRIPALRRASRTVQDALGGRRTGRS